MSTQVPQQRVELERTADLLRQALAARPDEASLLIRYGTCLLQLHRRTEALAIAYRVESLQLSAPQLEDALGALLTHLEEPLRALPHFQRAVALAPLDTQFRYNLAMAQRMTGQFEAAETNLDTVIAARPSDGEAFLARSDLRTQTPERNHVRELEAALQRLGGRAAFPVAYALAKELEDLGEHARSFERLQTASRAYRASLAYEVAGDIAVLNDLSLTHSREALGRLQSTVDNRECIFIIGLPRSGTTLVERILGCHSEVYAAGELDSFPSVTVRAVSRPSSGPVNKREFVHRSLTLDFSELGREYLDATRPRTGHTPRFTDKQPLNYLYAGLIHAALPRARFIAVFREPMDSCYAMYKTLFGSAYPFTYDLQDIARYYVAWRGLMRHWESLIGEAWLSVDYEHLVDDPEAMTRRMLDHCKLPWERACLRPQEGTSPVTTASAVQVRRPVNSDSVGKWRHYREQLLPVARYLRSQGISIEETP